MQNVGNSEYNGAFAEKSLKAAGRDTPSAMDDGDGDDDNELSGSNQDGQSTNPSPDNDYGRRANVVRHEPQGATLGED